MTCSLLPNQVSGQWKVLWKLPMYWVLMYTSAILFIKLWWKPLGWLGKSLCILGFFYSRLCWSSLSHVGPLEPSSGHIAWLWISHLPLTLCVALSKLVDPWGHLFICQMRRTNSAPPSQGWGGLNEGTQHTYSSTNHRLCALCLLLL